MNNKKFWLISSYVYTKVIKNFRVYNGCQRKITDYWKCDPANNAKLILRVIL